MIIEQVEALKIWLTNKLSPICDAEPSALAKYVCALVKKDKPEQDLRDICVDQLDVFLQQNTKPFVDELFEVLKTKLYIPPASEVKPRPAIAPPIAIKADVKVAPLPPVKDKEEPPKRKFSEISSTTDDKENKESHSAALNTSSLPASKDTAGDLRDSREPHRENREPRATSRDGRDRERDREGSRDRRDSWRDDKNKDSIRDARDIIRERVDRFDPRADTREVREPRDRDHRDRDRDFRRRRTRSRSISPRRREYEDRRRRFDERPRYSPERRWGRRRTWSRSPRRVRSPVDRGVRALRSRSPKLRSRSPRDIRYRPPYRSRTRSRSRPRSWSRPNSPVRLRTRSPSNARQPDSRGSTPLQDNDYISSSTNDLPAVTSTVGFRIEERADNRLPPNLEAPPPPVFVQTGRPRCQNFEEKGFCMLGDVCPYDHGSDPVVVEDVGIPNVLPASNPPGLSSSGAFIPPDLRQPPPGHMTMRLNLQRPPPQHVEPYLPEAPRLQGPPRQPFMRGPPDLRQPPPGMILNRLPHPDQFYPRREVIMNRPPAHLEDGAAGDMLISDKEPSRIVIPAKRPYSVLENDNMNIGPPASRITYLNQNHAMYGVPPPPQQVQPQQQNQNTAPIRRGFDYNRLGRGGNRGQGLRQPFKTGNLTLEVRKIPPELNNIAKLNEHFGKFGNLTNIQVKYQNDQGAALISFSNNGEATAAYRSPEPVFNNRFIKLFWHNPEKHVDMDGETESPVVTVKDDGREVQVQGQVTGGRVGDGIDHPSLVLPVRSAIPPAHKLQLDNTKPKPGAANATLEVSSNEPSDTSIVYTTSIGNLKKTVFNPGATVPAPAGAAVKTKATAPFVSPTAVKTADYVSRMEAIKRMEEDKKLATIKQAELELKRQELLAKQIEQQKFLLETLDKKKSVISKEEKASLLKALRTISDAIDKVKYSTGAKKPASAFQAPTPAQFKYVSTQDQVPAATIPAPQTYGRGRGWAGGRGGWVPRGRGRNMMPVIGRTHLDNRPKTVEVKGFDLSELDEIRAHFQRFGDIEKEEIVEDVPSAFFTFALRPSAEMAVSQGLKFKKKPLIVRWNQITPKISRAESTQSSEMDDDLSVTLGSLDEDGLLDISGEDKSETLESNQLSSEVQGDEAMDGTSSASGQQEMEEDSRMFVDSTKEEDPKPTERKPIIYERSLSEDLLAGTEQHFKASYTDEEDDEDHITVTLSNTTSSTPTIYTSGGGSYGATLEMDVGVGGDDGEDLSNTLDYNEEGSWD
ncbi:unnamed protein product [Lymnaea stagnalis]|uniref:RNA-binding protein 26 n=1 Tax=Lymnaea stagnalis TaxID=6523 RepID=A0AAV2HTV2_LYMST